MLVEIVESEDNTEQGSVIFCVQLDKFIFGDAANHFQCKHAEVLLESGARGRVAGTSQLRGIRLA